MEETNCANSRGVTIPVSPIFFKASKSLSPVTRYAQPALTAAARMGSSSGSRQTLGGKPMTVTGVVCRRTNEVSKRACRGLKPNLSRSFSSISSKISGEAQIRETPRTCCHIRRHCPLVVRIASQTLLSSRTRTRELKDFLFGQAGFSGQAVERGQQPIQFALLGKPILIKPHGLL